MRKTHEFWIRFINRFFHTRTHNPAPWLSPAWLFAPVNHCAVSLFIVPGVWARTVGVAELVLDTQISSRSQPDTLTQCWVWMTDWNTVDEQTIELKVHVCDWEGYHEDKVCCRRKVWEKTSCRCFLHKKHASVTSCFSCGLALTYISFVECDTVSVLNMSHFDVICYLERCVERCVVCGGFFVFILI